MSAGFWTLAIFVLAAIAWAVRAIRARMERSAPSFASPLPEPEEEGHHKKWHGAEGVIGEYSEAGLTDEEIDDLIARCEKKNEPLPDVREALIRCGKVLRADARKEGP